MTTSYPNLNIQFRRKPYSIDVNEYNQNEIINYGNLKDVTNYEYEVQKNEEKRKILILKPEYLSAFLQDMRNIMKYDKSSQTIDKNTKRTNNPKLNIMEG